MKEIKAIIQPFMLAKVIHALKAIEDLPGVTVSEVRGFGRSRAANASHKIVEETHEYGRKAKIEIVVPDEISERVVEIIRRAAHTGNPGDGKIFVIEVDGVIKIRTGQRGEAAM